jgi:hypothetical protein
VPPAAPQQPPTPTDLAPVSVSTATGSSSCDQTSSGLDDVSVICGRMGEHNSGGEQPTGGQSKISPVSQ